MAYIVVSLKGKEVGRWPLEGPLTIGRSAECEIIVRDILLSRRHCQIQPYRSGWIAVDLGSKNGTRSEEDGRRITQRGLRDGEELTLGKTRIRFRVGRLPITHKPPSKRPADPFEALAGTVRDFDANAAEAFATKTGLPQPRPIPREPEAYAQDDLYSLLTGIASSSWDSIYAQAAQPRRGVFRAEDRADTGGSVATLAPPRRTRQRFSDDLQAGDEVRTMRRVRPATPFEAQLTQPTGSCQATRAVQGVSHGLASAVIAAKPSRLGSRYRGQSTGAQSAVPAARPSARPDAPIGAWIRTVRRPLIALHKWLVPSGRVRLL